MKIFVFETEVTDPYYNLAVEDALCHYVSSETAYGEEICGIFVWQSDNAVVIGRNQNPIRECNMGALRAENVKLVRRLTGGGAVYHDLGNLNYSFISSETIASTERNLEIITNTLKVLGIDAICSGRNDITTKNNEKISGTAKKRYEYALLQHGTLLVSLDKDKAEKYLTPSQFKLSSKSIASVRSRMINISEIVRNCSVSKVKECLEEEFKTTYNNSKMFTPHLADKDFHEAYNMLISASWIMGENISEQWIVQKEWGTVRFSISEDNEHIQLIKYETDSIETDFVAGFFDDLKGMKLNKRELMDYLETLKRNKIYNSKCIRIATDLVEKIVAELQGEVNGRV